MQTDSKMLINLAAAPWTRRKPGPELRFESCEGGIVKALEAVPGETQVCVVCVQGPARIGKSTLMNSIVRWVLNGVARSDSGSDLYDKVQLCPIVKEMPAPGWNRCRASDKEVPSCFLVGHKTDPCTEGSDACLVRVPAGAFGRKSDLVVMVVDTEGQGDRGGDYDQRMALPARLMTAGGVNIMHVGFKAPVKRATRKMVIQAAEQVEYFWGAPPKEAAKGAADDADAVRPKLGHVVVLRAGASTDPGTREDAKALHESEIFEAMHGQAAAGAARGGAGTHPHEESKTVGEHDDGDSGEIDVFRRVFESGSVELLPAVELAPTDGSADAHPEAASATRVAFARCLESMLDRVLLPRLQDEAVRVMHGGVPMQAGALARYMPVAIEQCDQRGTKLTGMLEGYNQRALQAGVQAMARCVEDVLGQPGVLAGCPAAAARGASAAEALLQGAFLAGMGPSTLNREEALGCDECKEALTASVERVREGLQGALQRKREDAQQAVMQAGRVIWTEVQQQYVLDATKEFEDLQGGAGEATSFETKRELGQQFQAFATKHRSDASVAVKAKAQEAAGKCATDAAAAVQGSIQRVGVEVPEARLAELRASHHGGEKGGADSAGAMGGGAGAGETVRQSACQALMLCSVEEAAGACRLGVDAAAACAMLLSDAVEYTRVMGQLDEQVMDGLCAGADGEAASLLREADRIEQQKKAEAEAAEQARKAAEAQAEQARQQQEYERKRKEQEETAEREAKERDAEKKRIEEEYRKAQEEANRKPKPSTGKKVEREVKRIGKQAERVVTAPVRAIAKVFGL